MSVHDDNLIIQRFNAAFKELLTLRHEEKKRVLDEHMNEILAEFEILINWQMK